MLDLQSIIVHLGVDMKRAKFEAFEDMLFDYDIIWKMIVIVPPVPHFTSPLMPREALDNLWAAYVGDRMAECSKKVVCRQAPGPESRDSIFIAWDVDAWQAWNVFWDMLVAYDPKDQDQKKELEDEMDAFISLTWENGTPFEELFEKYEDLSNIQLN